MASIGIDFSDEFVGALADALAPLIAERLQPEQRQWLTAHQGRSAFQRTALARSQAHEHGCPAGSSSQTREDYAYLICEYAIPFFDRKAIGDIGPLDVKQFIEHLATLTQKGRRCLWTEEPCPFETDQRRRCHPRASAASSRR